MKPTKVDPLLKKAIYHTHKTSELVDDNIYVKRSIGDSLYLKLDQSTPQTLTANPRILNGFSITRDEDGNIESIEYDNGRIIEYTRSDGQIQSWTDGVATWTIVRDGDTITGINVTLI